jgi:hypothetical protein
MTKHNRELAPVLDDRERQPDEERIEAEGGERAHLWTSTIAATAVRRSFRIPELWLATSATLSSRSMLVSFPLRLLVIVLNGGRRTGNRDDPFAHVEGQRQQRRSDGSNLNLSGCPG